MAQAHNRHNRLAFSRLMSGNWWWHLWAAGVVVTWVPWLVLFASLPFARRTMDGPMSDAMFAGMTSFGLVVPSVVVASGLAIFVRRATAKTPVGSFLSEPSVAFLCIVVAGTLAFAATVDTPADFVNGVVTNCVVGQLAPGLYLPFAAPVAAAYAASKTPQQYRCNAIARNIAQITSRRNHHGLCRCRGIAKRWRWSGSNRKAQRTEVRNVVRGWLR